MPTWMKDLAERAFWTFIQTFLAVWLLSTSFDLGVVQACAVSGLAAAASVVKSTLASRFGEPTASTVRLGE